MRLTVKLRDIHPGMVAAWRHHFEGVADIEVSEGDIFGGGGADAIVSPANSFGFMDGGIDLVYSEFFGWDLQARLQTHLQVEHDGELPVGQATLVPTHHADIPWLVCAPTMRIPSDVSETTHAYLAFRATLRAIRAFNAAGLGPIRTVLCPGLGTAVGRMPHERCARQMRHAHDIVLGGRANQHRDLFTAVSEHVRLLLR